MLTLDIVESLRLSVSGGAVIPFDAAYTFKGVTYSNAGFSRGSGYADIIESSNDAIREVTYLNITNSTGSTVTVTLEVYNIQLFTITRQWQFTLSAGDTVQYSPETGFNVLDSTGAIKESFSASTLPLPAGAATESTLVKVQTGTDFLDVQLSTIATEVTLAALSAKITNPLPVSGTFFQATQPISGTVTAIQGTGTNLHVVTDSGTITTVGTVTTVSTVTAVTAITNALPAGTNNIGDVDVLSLPAIPAGTNNIGDVDVASLPKAATVAQTSVADSASNQTILASNANRLGATIYNDSTVALYLKLGATASTTSFTVKMVADGYYEVPFGYTGIIDGIWASDASGSARITELTA